MLEGALGYRDTARLIADSLDQVFIFLNGTPKCGQVNR